MGADTSRLNWEGCEVPGGVKNRHALALALRSSDTRFWPAPSATFQVLQSSRVEGHADVWRSTGEESAASADRERDAWLNVLEQLSHIDAARLFYAVYVKRAIDLVAGGILLLLCMPFLLVLSLWIMADSFGNPFFCQPRIGRNGNVFKVIKLRTMQPCAAKGLVWITDERGQQRHKIANDPRITRSGKFLRRTSLDELPQLWNVVRGQMSLVGPRPELPEIVSRYAPRQHQRHVVRPGITGWWQVSGRSTLPMHEHTDLDLYYVGHASAHLDWQIALKTIGVVFRRHGAF